MRPTPALSFSRCGGGGVQVPRARGGGPTGTGGRKAGRMVALQLQLGGGRKGKGRSLHCFGSAEEGGVAERSSHG